ncbi:transcriptional regulator, ArsR family [Tindallia magadiensis]|uniref:Transcriptional regulator, ArsR family n=1 Tax=Tindallia magadiensis TaxID=69895 RepID=A0A1I3FDG6_9FIRM|nr:transcriptional regulator, ArsR family [Tindallia magadiensis]
MTKDYCEVTVIHHDQIKETERKMISNEQATELAYFFKVFSDPTRVKILYALSLQEMCVCDISYLLNASQSAISHQLKMLRQARVVKSRRDGKIIYYSLDDDHIQRVFNQGLEHINEK